MFDSIGIWFGMTADRFLNQVFWGPGFSGNCNCCVRGSLYCKNCIHKSWQKSVELNIWFLDPFEHLSHKPFLAWNEDMLMTRFWLWKCPWANASNSSMPLCKSWTLLRNYCAKSNVLAMVPMNTSEACEIRSLEEFAVTFCAKQA